MLLFAFGSSLGLVRLLFHLFIEGLLQLPFGPPEISSERTSILGESPEVRHFLNAFLKPPSLLIELGVFDQLNIDSNPLHQFVHVEEVLHVVSQEGRIQVSLEVLVEVLSVDLRTFVVDLLPVDDVVLVVVDVGLLEVDVLVVELLHFLDFVNDFPVVSVIAEVDLDIYVPGEVRPVLVYFEEALDVLLLLE